MTGAVLSIPSCAVAFGSYRGVKLFKFAPEWADFTQIYYSVYGMVGIGSTLNQTMFLIDLTIGGHNGF